MVAPETERHSGYVGLLGRPNVGKSTLLNRLLGQDLVITSHKPQTTRHAILGIKSAPLGQILYLDTPGMHQRGAGALNRYLNRTARSVIHQVDLVLLLVEALRWTPEDDAVLKALEGVEAPVLVAVNKIDRVPNRAELLPYLSRLAQRYAFRELVPISATRGEQIQRLEGLLYRWLPPGEPLYPENQLSDRPERFFAAELLREQLTRRYAKELPYRLSVEIERFDEEARRILIHALIWVERPGQKAILIGKDGRALKEAAREARLKMGAFFDRPVHLEVWVKVKKSWSSDEAALVRLGYGDP